MTLYQANYGEKIRVRLYDRKGRTHKKDVRRLYRFLRDRRTGKKRVMNWRLLKHLYTVSRKFPGKTLMVYSAYRSRKLPPGRESRHKTGRALDFRVNGVNKAKLRDYLMKRFKKVGVGYYPNVPFVHLDIRKRSAFWVDTSKSGQRANYVKNPYAWLKRSRKPKVDRRKLKKLVAAKLKASAKPKAAASTASAAVAAASTAAVTVTPAPLPPPVSDEPAIVLGPPPLGPGVAVIGSTE